MRKKYLSALLFGALLVTSAGTFTSCKDYDDEINNLQEQITDLQTAVKSLEELVNAGKYVTAVEKTAEGIKFTFNQGDPVVIALEEATQEGQVFELRDGEIYVDNEPTGIKPAKDPEKAPVKVENGVWMFLNAEGEYESTDIPVSGVNVSGSEEEGFVLEIIDANGNSQKVEIPTANSLVTSISFAVPAGELTEKYFTAEGGFYTVDGVKHTGYMSELKADGTRGVSVNVVVTPSNVDPKDLKFSLVDSNGETIFNEAVVSQPNDKLTRAMDGVYTLTFALKEAITDDDLTEITDDQSGKKCALAVSCGKATTEFGATYDGTAISGNGNINFNGNKYIKKGETYSIFGKVYSVDPSTDSEATPNKKIIDQFSNISSLKLSVDKDYAEAYGVTISEDGTSFTVTKGESDGDGTYSVTLDVIYTDKNSTSATATEKTTVRFNISSDEITADATLKASHELSTTKNVVYLPVAELLASMTAEERVAWNNANDLTIESIVNNKVTTDKFTVTSSKKYGEGASAKSLTTDDLDQGITYHKADANKSNITLGSSTLKDVAYIGVKIDPEQECITADTYSSLVQFTFDSKKVQGTIEITLTNPTNPVTRIPLYFDGDKLAAYGEVNSSNLEFDVTSAYNNTTAVSDFKVESKETDEDKEWKVNNSTEISIPLDELYSTTQDFEVSYLMFANATYNKVTETITVTGQSPIKDGEVTVLKTELSLATGSDTFTAKDIKGVDVFNKEYVLFATATAETETANASVTTTDDRIKSITLEVTDNNKGAFEVYSIYSWVNDKKLYQVLVDEQGTIKEYISENIGSKVGDAISGVSNAVITGFSVKLKETAGIANGAKVPFKLTITDEWGQKVEKEISLTVENN